MARATSSLPEPDGPQSITEAFERAIRRIISRSRHVASLVPMISASSASLLFCPTVISVSTAPPIGAFSMDPEIDETGKQNLIVTGITHSKQRVITILEVIGLQLR